MLQLVSRHVIEIQEVGFKKFGTELRRAVGLHQILVGNVRPGKLDLLFRISARIL